MRSFVVVLFVAVGMVFPSLASARVLPSAEVGLLDRGALAFDEVPPSRTDGVRLLDGRLDPGAGADATRGGILPALLSLVVPGLGQVWNGQIVKGIVVFGVALFLYSGGAWFFSLAYLLAVAVHVLAIIDAYQAGGVIPNIGGGGDVPERLRSEAARVASRWLDARPATLAWR